MHIKRNTDFVAFQSMAMELSERIPDTMWDRYLDAQYTTVHDLLSALSGGEYDTKVILNEAHELTIIVDKLRNNFRDNLNRRTVQAETLEMSMARLTAIGIYSFYDSVVVQGLHKVDRGNYIHAVRVIISHFVAGTLLHVKNHKQLTDTPPWSILRLEYHRVLNMFYPTLHRNNPWQHFKSFMAPINTNFIKATRIIAEEATYGKAYWLTNVYNNFNSVELVSKDTVLEVCGKTFNSDWATYVDLVEEQL